MIIAGNSVENLVTNISMTPSSRPGLDGCDDNLPSFTPPVGLELRKHAQDVIADLVNSSVAFAVLDIAKQKNKTLLLTSAGSARGQR
jgi:hypothetical protein